MHIAQHFAECTTGSQIARLTPLAQSKARPSSPRSVGTAPNARDPWDDDGWHQPSPVLERFVDSLFAHLDDLLDTYMSAIKKTEGYSLAFASGSLTEAEVRQKAYPSLEYLLHLISGRKVPERLAGVPQLVGRTRAEQGFPLTSLMQGLRQNFRVVWAALLEQSRPSDHKELLSSAFRVWEAVEGYSLGVIAAYQQTELEAARRHDDVRRSSFQRLLEYDGSHPAILHQAASVLDFELGADFLIAVAASQGRRWLWDVSRDLTSRGTSCHRQETQDGEVLVAQLSPRNDRLIAAALGSVTCCVARVGTLAEVPEAVRHAAVISRMLPEEPRRPISLNKAWLSVIAAETVESLGRSVNRDVLQGLHGLSDSERRMLLETVTAYLAGAGTAADTAHRVFCHRNTVINRLRRFTELTGLDITRPRDGALALMSLLFDKDVKQAELMKLRFGEPGVLPRHYSAVPQHEAPSERPRRPRRSEDA